MRPNHYIFILFLALFYIPNTQAQTITMSDPSVGATAVVYTFNYTTSHTIGTGTPTSNIFVFYKTGGFPNFINPVADSNLLGTNVVLKVDGVPVTIDATTFGTTGGAGTTWIQMSVLGASSGLTINAGSAIEVEITDIIVNPLSPGTHTYEWFTSEAGGTVTESFQDDVTFTTLSVDDNALAKVKAYPNPFIDRTFIETNEALELKIYDLLGKLVSVQQVDKNNKEIAMTGFTTGVYLARVKNNSNQSKILKLIKN